MLRRCDGLRSSQTTCAREPATIVVRILVGLSQFTWACGDRAAVEGQGQVADAGPAGSDRVGAVGGHGHRPAVGRQHDVEDRQVVRREIPEHVDVALHQPQVDPHGVDVVDLPQRAAAHEVADAPDHRRVAVGVVAHEDPLVGLGRRDDRPALGTDEASGFSTNTCLPASRHAVTTSAWVAAGVATATASTDVSSSTLASWSVTPTVLWRPTAAAARSRSRSHTQRRSQRG